MTRLGTKTVSAATHRLDDHAIFGIYQPPAEASREGRKKQRTSVYREEESEAGKLPM